ncbi:MAG: hypothetical protein J0649_06980, partial [Methylococcales bacterium]|nr:hypothetical protein [Methylococcales bacterium]
EHGIIFPDSCNINPPELGVVEYFSFWAYKDYNADIETEAKEDDLKSIEIDSEININALLIENLKQNEVALNQISMDIKEKEFSINQLKL